ncbi:MAG: phosphate starvation-inducible protein PhoH [Bacteroidales bacterium 36-12]|nr:MAG: phosphate starvation-inducible protein PhoH [Bacteroidales bacterium 36-12]
MGKKKNFVLDTNVILHDYRCIFNFEENDVYIPMVVLEELDHFKKGNEQINFNAREFSRELDLLANEQLFKKGVEIGEGMGRLYIMTNMEYPSTMSKIFFEKTSDHSILAASLQLQEEMKKTKTILITKDINLRMKALSLGLIAEDYINDKVTNHNIFDKNHEIYENVPTEIIEQLYSQEAELPVEALDFASDIEPQDCFVLRSNRASVLARYNPHTNSIKRISKERCFGIEPRNAEQTFAINVLLDDSVKLVALTGKSGTGKTLLALAAALQKHDAYKQILLARPIIALANRDLGFLPGDEQHKVAPYMQPLFDNLNVIKNQFSYQGKEVRLIEELQRNNQLVIEALAYIRGRSLSETFFIVDEAQNLTPHEVKTIITRAGEGTKIVFTGDIQQIDSPYLDMFSNGLVYMIDRMHGQDIFAHINLVKGERSYLSELASNLL